MQYTGCFSRKEIEGFIPPEPSILICIFDPNAKEHPQIDPNHWVDICYEQFWDSGGTHSSSEEFVKLYPPASKDQLDRIYHTIQTAAKCNVFASCEAGVSRSAAIREFLIRRGFTHFGNDQKNRMVHPNTFVLAELERRERDRNEK